MSEIPAPHPDESQRVDDPEKARYMAQAGDEDRTEAADARRAADILKSFPDASEDDFDGGLEGNIVASEVNEERKRREDDYRLGADGSDDLADAAEDRAGRKYDEEHS